MEVVLIMKKLAYLICALYLIAPLTSSAEEFGPKGVCEFVGSEQKISIMEHPEIESYQPIIKRDRMVLLLKNSSGQTIGLLLRVVKPSSSKMTSTYVEAFSLNYPTMAIKIEQTTDEKTDIELNGRYYIGFITFDRKDWVPHKKMSSSREIMQREIWVIEQIWNHARHSEVVSECANYSDDFQETEFNNCQIPENDCETLWYIASVAADVESDAKFLMGSNLPPLFGRVPTWGGSQSCTNVRTEILNSLGECQIIDIITANGDSPSSADNAALAGARRICGGFEYLCESIVVERCEMGTNDWKSTVEFTCRKKSIFAKFRDWVKGMLY